MVPQMSSFTNWGKVIFLRPLPIPKLVETDWGGFTLIKEDKTQKQGE